jgi:V/A-type H+-transporting ATPase subunit F
MKKIVVVTPPDARHGFALAGVRQMTATPADVSATLQQLVSDARTGVIVVDERLVVGPTRERIREMERHWPGVVIVLPSPEKAARVEEDYVLQLIRRAIGYQVRLSP